MTPITFIRDPTQMEEEGVPSTALREVSLLQMLSESNHIVKCAHLGPLRCIIPSRKPEAGLSVVLLALRLIAAERHAFLVCSGCAPNLRHRTKQEFVSLYRLLCVEHVEELNKPVLYLVSNYSPSSSLCYCCSLACSCLQSRRQSSARDAACSSLSPALADGV